MKIKFDALKEKAILAAVGNIPYCYEKLAPWAILAGIESGKYGWRKNAEEIREKVIRIIERWDVRRVKALIELFPSIVPQKYAKASVQCYMEDNENADWVMELII